MQTLFYATLGNALLALLLLAASGVPPVPGAFLPAFLGGVLWTCGGLCAFAACARLGPAVAMSVWAPLNILASVAFGWMLFGEWLGISLPSAALRVAGLVALVVGLAIIIGPVSADGGGQRGGGLGFAFLAGLLWGAYLLPVRIAGVAANDATLPMALGMVFSAAAWCVFQKVPLRMAGRFSWAWLGSAGVLWGVGNFCLLLLIDRIGLGMAFAVAQLCLVVNAMVGMAVFHEPPLSSAPGKRLLAGCLIAVAGGAAIGLALAIPPQ